MRRIIVLITLIAVLVGCARNQTAPVQTPTVVAIATLPPTTESTATPPPTRTPRPTVTLAPTPTFEPTTAESLLKVAPARYCRNGEEYACFTPLAVRISDYLFTHPTDPQKTQLTQRLFEISRANPQIRDSNRAVLGEWMVQNWVMTAAQTLSHVLTSMTQTHQLNDLIFIPANLDGDDLQDYVVKAVTRATGPYEHIILWLRWIDGAWQMMYLGSVGEYSSPVFVADVNGDGQQDLIINSITCGSACSHWLSVRTWRDGKWQSLLEPLDQGHYWTLTPTATSFDFISTYPVSIRYQFNGEVMAPSELLYPSGRFASRTGTQMDYAHALLQLGRYDEAIQALEIAANQKEDGSAPFGYKSSIKDARPLALFRIGMVHVIQNKPDAAHSIWQQLITTYPKEPLSQTVQDLDLLNFKGNIGDLCLTLDAIKPMPKWYADQFFYSNQFPYNGYDWLSVCNPELLIPLQTWQTTTPLTDQMQLLGMDWQELSAAYDLNSDGTNDVLGRVKFVGLHTFWAMLSNGTQYQPLNAMQPWGIDTPLSGVTFQNYNLRLPEPPQLLDLDANNQPELLFRDGRTHAFLLAWTGSRFALSYADFEDYARGTNPLTSTLTLESQADGTQWLVGTQPITDTNAPTPQRYSYKLEQNRLVQLEPLAYESQHGFLTYEVILTALYAENDPNKALNLLDEYIRIYPDQADQHEYLVLRALALEYSGKIAESQQLFDQVATSKRDTGWRLLALERGK